MKSSEWVVENALCALPQKAVASILSKRSEKVQSTHMRLISNRIS
jgi:hypothetical protein